MRVSLGRGGVVAGSLSVRSKRLVVLHDGDASTLGLSECVTG